MAYIRDDITIRERLEDQVRFNPGRIFLRFEDASLTVSELDRRVNRLANGLFDIGLKPGDRVAIMLLNHPDHIVTFLACAKLGLVQIPVNIHLRGASLEYLLEHADPRATVADASLAEALIPALAHTTCELAIWRRGRADIPGLREYSFDDVLAAGREEPPPGRPQASDVLAICYTSGTTGPPKGVLVTDKMCRVSAAGAAVAADFRPGDIQFLWAPLFHIGGIQTLVASVENDITLALGARFSASKYWDQVRYYGATKIHYVGGIVAILLKQPQRQDDRQNPVKIAWGGGAPANLWQNFMDRFDVKIREIYGMTECSSISHVNTDGRVGSVGRALPYFEAKVIDDQSHTLPPGQMGEIILREREPGLITRGYFRSPEATAQTLRDGWLHTGDFGAADQDGFYRYLGRKKDSIRRRGENVSAWEVERVLQTHPAVEECAVVGVDSDVGDQEIKAFMKLLPGRDAEPLDIIKHCESRLAYFQIPRYLAFVTDFAKTPTHRIQKSALSRSSTDCWDLVMSEYSLRRV